MSTHHSARFVIYQETAGIWIGRGLEHDLAVESHSIGEAARAIVRLVEAHTSLDARHDRAPLSAFKAASQSYWNAFTTGTPVSLAQFGIVAPEGWDLFITIAHSRPTAARVAWPFQSSERRSVSRSR